MAQRPASSELGSVQRLSPAEIWRDDMKVATIMAHEFGVRMATAMAWLAEDLITCPPHMDEASFEQACERADLSRKRLRAKEAA
jgi:hypothetical protein